MVRNPLLKLYNEVTPKSFEANDYLRHVESRVKITREYSWAVPTQRALKVIAAHAPIVEMGAGTGYWASLLKKMGCDVIAYDRWTKEKSPFGLNMWNTGNKFTEVLCGGPRILSKHSDRTLFLCWPPLGNVMAYDCLRYWRGKTLVYVGEFNGCCATPSFFKALNKSFLLETQEKIPQWLGIHDVLTVWTRNDQ